MLGHLIRCGSSSCRLLRGLPCTLRPSFCTHSARMSKDQGATPAQPTVTKVIVTSPLIYKPLGPYSQAVLADRTLYVSGLLGMSADGVLAPGGAAEQTRQLLNNLALLLQAGGASMRSVLKTTVLLADIRDFAAVNKVYAEYFPSAFPARATYQVAQLPCDAAVEIDCVALSGAVSVAQAGPCPCSKQ